MATHAARAGSVYLLGNLISAAVPLLLLPLLTRALPPAEYGAVVNFALLVAAAGAFAGLGVNGLLGVAWFRQHGDSLARESSAAVAVLFGSTLLTAGAAALAVAIAAPQWLGFGAAVAALAAATAGAQTLVQCRLALWQSAEQPWRNAALQIGASLLNVALSLGGVLLLDWGGLGRIAGMAAAALVVAALALASLGAQGLLRQRPRASEVRAALAFGVPLVPHVLAGALLTGGDRLLVASQLGASAAGTYGAAAQLGALMALMADAFVKAFNPWLFRRLQDERPAAHLQAVGAMYAALPALMVVAALMWAVLLVVAPVLLGPAYRESLHVLPWFMLGGAFSGAYLAVSGLYFFYHRTAALSAFSFPCAVVGLAVTVALVRGFGATGAAAGYAFTQGLLACVAWWMARRRFPLPWRPPGPALGAWCADLRASGRQA